jgi:4'-phosphopantetheinyl transferase
VDGGPAGLASVPDVVDLWLIRSDVPPDVLVTVGTCLDDDERRKADALPHPADRRRFTVAHGGVRRILADVVGAPADDIRWRRGPHGKPELVGPACDRQTSLSHSDDLVVLAISRRRRVGVDVQALTPTLDAVRLAARYYAEDEATYVAAGDPAAVQVDRFVRLWTRKEACVKATGGCLAQGLALPVRAEGQDDAAPRSACLVVHDPHGQLPGPYTVRDVAVPLGFGAAVALEGTAPFSVSCRWWPPTADAAGSYNRDQA